ncbi:MAG: hypothetical protein JWO39_750 [Gemmatimonadetes bacterium]|jgi:hypothetical protein|nr:hypothetical protein [Gemmatimonadota bacterium]
MREHDNTTLIFPSARNLALVAALLLSSAAFSQRATAQDAAAPPPSDSVADSARAYAAPSSVWNAQRVRRVIKDGTEVVLTDGTIWEVYLPDRPAVNTWKPGDLLIVREAAVMQGEYDYTIKDGRTRKLVWVRLVGDVSSRS